MVDAITTNWGDLSGPYKNLGKATHVVQEMPVSDNVFLSSPVDNIYRDLTDQAQ